MNPYSQQPQPEGGHHRRNRQSGWLSSQTIIGIGIVLFGLFMFLKRSNVYIPHWLTSWEVILIFIGILVGLRSGFKDVNWIILIVIGSAFLMDDLFAGYSMRKFGWPVALIIVGLIIAFKPRIARRQPWLYKNDDMPPPGGGTTMQQDFSTTQDASSWDKTQGEVLDVSAVFGGVKRNVMSKNFRGGEIVAVFGGAEINLSNADFEGVIRIESVSVFGGTKLYVPPNWDVQSEMVAVFGGVDDKRIIRPELIDPKKKLVLEGTCFLGGLEIRSF
ncbi:MAG TPA: hypothetical protein VLC98_01680 [Phnomibacter sp.]|nr:hypothetical protein [Phnomibacter sp.]